MAHDAGEPVEGEAYDEQADGYAEQEAPQDDGDLAPLPNIRYWNSKGTCGEGDIHLVQEKTQVPWPTLLRVMRGWKKNPSGGWYFKAQGEWPQEDGFQTGSRMLPRHYRKGVAGKYGPPLIEGPNTLQRAIDMEEGAARELFSEMDVNGNGKLSLAEIDKAIVDKYSDFNHKPVLMRAMKLADRMGNHDGLMEFQEFDEFIKFMVVYTDMWNKFDAGDGDDRRMDLEEFTNFIQKEGIEVEDPAEAFAEADRNGGGQLLFDEFCYWLAHKKGIDHLGTSDGLVGYQDSTGARVGEGGR